MKLTFTARQLNAILLAGVLNQAFIKSDVIESTARSGNVSFFMNDLQRKMSILGNTLQPSQVIRGESTASQASVLNIVDHINRITIHVNMPKPGSIAHISLRIMMAIGFLKSKPFSRFHCESCEVID